MVMAGWVEYKILQSVLYAAPVYVEKGKVEEGATSGCWKDRMG